VAYTNFHKVRGIQFLQFSAVMVLVWRRRGPENDSIHVFSFKSGQSGKLVPQIIQSCPPNLPVLNYFYLLDIWRVAVVVKEPINHVTTANY